MEINYEQSVNYLVGFTQLLKQTTPLTYIQYHDCTSELLSLT